MLLIENLVKSYPGQHGQDAMLALRDVSFKVEEGSFFTLLGPSGCGKTTTLQCIAGLENPDTGVIQMGDRAVFSSRENLLVPANRRELGMFFQSYASWPHMSVFDNVAFPLVYGVKRAPSHEVRPRGGRFGNGFVDPAEGPLLADREDHREFAQERHP